MEKKFKEILGKIQSAKTVGIFCHINPDADTLGSALALFLYLRKVGKGVAVYVDATHLPLHLSGVAGYDKVILGASADLDTDFLGIDLLVSMDTADEARLGKYADVFVSHPNTINIDHHISNTGYAKINLVRETSANTEIVLEVLQSLDYFETKANGKPTLICRDIAMALYIGLVADNGNFSFKSVNGNTFLIASKIMSYGLSSQDIFDVNNMLFKSLSLAKFKLQRALLNNVKFFYDNKLAVSYLTLDDFVACGNTKEGTEGLIHNLLNIDSVEIAVSFRQESIDKDGLSTFKVSFRSKGWDVNYLANQFGGGGHRMAAGAKLRGDVYEVIDLIVDKVKQLL
ncbi:MAG: bifunctional oligoribonuclease/PAP phosphatase NrnA [Firmicutes bacterium]|nr:bifunctional oligoribonuclease/PAP phosphatase NrnA [Bacillota bacterium]